jgi:ABC-type nitrate/sulfonate/bicarbonate transport system substrate-binding protein
VSTPRAFWVTLDRPRYSQRPASDADGGHVLVNEAARWPGGQFATAELVVTTRFLSAHPAMVNALLRAHVQGTDLLDTDRTASQAAAVTAFSDLFGASLPAPLLTASFAQITFTNDPLAATMLAEAREADKLAGGPFRPRPPEQAAACRRAGHRTGMTRAAAAHERWQRLT